MLDVPPGTSVPTLFALRASPFPAPQPSPSVRGRILRWLSAQPSAVSARRTSRTTEPAAGCSLSPRERVRVRGNAALLVGRVVAFVTLVFTAMVAGAQLLGGPPVASDLNDYLLVPLRVHLLSAKESPDISTTLTDKDIARILGKVNRVWAQAGLHFYLESLAQEEAANPELFLAHKGPAERFALLSLRAEETKASNLFHVYFLKQMTVNGIFLGEAIFVKDTASLREVEGGMDEPLPRVTAHELGHAFGLAHRQDKTNLMASGTTGIRLNEEETRQVRERAKRFPWIEPATVLRQRADEWARTGKPREAEALYQRLAALATAVNGPPTESKREPHTTKAASGAQRVGR